MYLFVYLLSLTGFYLFLSYFGLFILFLPTLIASVYYKRAKAKTLAKPIGVSFAILLGSFALSYLGGLEIHYSLFQEISSFPLPNELIFLWFGINSLLVGFLYFKNKGTV